MFRRIWHIVIKEFIQALRVPRLRLFVVLPPLIQLIIDGYAINFDIKHIDTAIYDEDRTPESRDLITRFADPAGYGTDHLSANCEWGRLYYRVHPLKRRRGIEHDTQLLWRGWNAAGCREVRTAAPLFRNWRSLFNWVGIFLDSKVVPRWIPVVDAAW